MRRPRFQHAVTNDVFDEDWNEGLQWRIDELLSGLLGPLPDLSGSPLVAKPLVTG